MTMVMVMMMTIDISIWSVVFVTQKREPFQTWLVSPTGSKNLQMSNIPKKIQRFSIHLFSLFQSCLESFDFTSDERILDLIPSAKLNGFKILI